jgi:hypothetical protein
MTLEQFLDWEERQEAKYEFNGFEPVLIGGGTEEQAEIQANILIALGSRLQGYRCRVLGSDLKIKVMERIRYPDAFVVRSPRERGRTVVTDPVIVFEIVSDSTQHSDLVEKNDEYRETPLHPALHHSRTNPYRRHRLCPFGQRPLELQHPQRTRSCRRPCRDRHQPAARRVLRRHEPPRDRPQPIRTRLTTSPAASSIIRDVPEITGADCPF